MESNIVVSESLKSKIPGKVIMDYAQNSSGKTMVCPYSLRVTPQATISMPLEWGRIKKGLKPVEFNIFSVPCMQDNPWKGILNEKQRFEVG
jgi:bifunctional non-homologous end joining protein LigD